MAIVYDYYIGKTRIILTDDEFCKEDEIPLILERIGRKASMALQAEANRKAQEMKQDLQRPKNGQCR